MTGFSEILRLLFVESGLDVSSTGTWTKSDNVNKETLVMSFERKQACSFSIDHVSTHAYRTDTGTVPK